MALQPLNADKPLGQFDVKDADLANIKGGEVMTFKSVVATSATDKAASDAFDGYVNPASRAYATFVTAVGDRPLMLTDEGISGYGTLFGTVVGGTVGQVSTGGAVLGPHTATGSGKVTLWGQPGLYAISIDALASDVQPTTGAIGPGTALYAPVGGVITSTAGSNPKIGSLVEFATNGSLVTTPNTLVGTFNPPDGALTTTVKSPKFAVIWFQPAN